MRNCPRCEKHTLDVTGKKVAKALHYLCWTCGFTCMIKPLTDIEIEKISRVGKK